MPNPYTGDFDVVAEFAIPALNRLLAAMHQTERLLHSISVRVDDNPLPGSRHRFPVLGGVVDAFGDAVASQNGIGKPNPFPGPAAVTNAVLARQDPVVNVGSVTVVPIVPSHLQGKAQMQLFPPTVDVPDATGENLALRMNAMARYFPDPQTAPLAEFIRGDLQIIAPVNQVRSKAANVVEIDFKATEASIAFTPSYSSQPLTEDDVAGINLLIRNALVTSFQPSSATLPTAVADVQFKTLIGAPKAIAVLLNMSAHAAGSASVTSVFLGGADDFAYAASRDFALASLQPVVDNLLSQPFPPAKFSVNLGLTTLHFTYPITLESAAFDLLSGKIVMTVAGHAGQSNHSWAGPFDFTVTMDFTLAPAGATVTLVSGSISVDASSLLAELVDFFTGAVTNAIASARDAALQTSGAAATVSEMFDADQNLGNFLNSLLAPVAADAPPPDQRVELVYDRVDIEPAAIVLHGSLLLFGWPAAHVEYQPVPSSSGGGPFGSIVHPFGDGPDYSALKSWIPGGTIGQYEWSIEGLEQAFPFSIDQHKFVLLHSGPAATTGAAAVSGTSGPGSGAAVVGSSGSVVTAGGFVPPAYSPICLTVRGTRIAAAGPAVYQPVSGSVCGYTRLPVIAGALTSSAGFAPPALPVTKPGPAGEVLVTGHTTALVARNASEAPSVLVHFADAKSATQLDLLTKALAQSGRSDAPVAVVAVVPAAQLARIRYTQRVIYAEDADGAWARLYGVTGAHRPVTLIVGRQGTTLWKEEGPVDRDALAAALARTLVGGGSAPLSVPLLNARIGQPAPNFLFEYARGRVLPLRKLAGRPVVLVFWRSTSAPSIQAVLEAERGSAAGPALVLAVNDGEPADHARAAAAAHGVTTVVVADSKREISLAYGVTLWPTILTLDAGGTITAIRFGHAPAARGGESR
jgi:AhpC/TSA family